MKAATLKIILTMAMAACLPYLAIAMTASQVYESVKDSVVIVKAYDQQGKQTGLGSGVMVPSGEIITNYHVVEAGVRYTVGKGKQTTPAILKAGDPDKDLCLLTAPGLVAEPARLGRTDRLKVGEPVYAVGAPQGLELSLSEGIVSQLRGGGPHPIIQTTVAISPGSSGGGLFNAKGELVGITTFCLKDGQSLNFALPVEWIGEVAEKKIKERPTDKAPSGLGAAQTNAPGEEVIIPGLNIPGWGQVDKVSAHFARPAGSKPKAPAVLILHGAFGIDGRGAFYSKALNEAGIATLEITMFPPSSPPREGLKSTMPHAAAALKWLAAQPGVDGQRLGVMGFSWGGIMTVLLSSELVQERLGKDVPRPVAFAPFYPTCSVLARTLVNPKLSFYNAHTRMSGAPMLIQVGTRDDYEENEHTCDGLVAMWPAAAREHTTVRYIEGATHDFDSQKPGTKYYARFAHGGHGGMVNVVPSPKDAVAARQAVVNFFVKHLHP